MADTKEAIRRLSIQATTTGVDTATGQLNKLAAAQDGVAVASSNTEKATLSLDSKFANIERRYVAGVKSQQDYEKTQRLVNQAVSQNPALQDRANVILAAAKDRHDQLSNSQRALSVVASDLNSRIQASAGSFGIAGQAISALGPVGLGVAATMGSVAVAFYAASAGAHDLASKARELKDFSESTGLTVTQVQALRSEATKFGVDSDTLQTGLQKFTAGFQDLRLGSGDLLAQIRRINPALVDQMAAATDTATAFTLYAKAVQQTTNIFERNALARAGLGKGGPTVAEFLGNLGDVNALGAAFGTAGKGLQKDLIDKLSDLDVQISKTTSAAKRNIESIFAQPVLEAELAMAKAFLSLSDSIKSAADAAARLPKELPSWATAMLAGAKFGFVDLPSAAVRTVLNPGATFKPAPDLSGEAGRAGYNQGTGKVSTEQLGPPAPTLEFRLEALQNQLKYLGDAATASERLKVRTAELDVALAHAGLTQDNYNRAISAARLDAAISMQSAHNSALGAATSATDVLKLKTLELARAQQQGAGLTKDQIENQKRLAVEQSLGITQIKASTDAYKLEGATIGMSTGDALAYVAVQNQINEARRNGKTLTQDNIASITAEAQAMGRAASAVENTRFVYDTARSAVQSFSQNLRQGQSAWEAFKNAGIDALGKIADKLMDMAFNNLWANAFGGSGGGLLSSLFGIGGGGGGGGVASTISVGSQTFPSYSAKGNVFANDNRFATGGAFTNSVVTRPTAFQFANGGVPSMGVMGEAGPEAVMPLARGADGKLGVSGGGGAIHIDASDNRTISITGGDQQSVAQIKDYLAKDRAERKMQVVEIVRQAKSQRLL